MPFLTPENILQDKDNTLNKKEKSQLQSFAKQLNQIWDKVKIYLNKNLNSQEEKNWMPDSEKKIWPLPQLKSQVSQSNWESYKQRTIESIKSQFNLGEIAKNPAKRTPENVAMLQLFLFLKGAYAEWTKADVESSRNIDGKRGKKTEDACYKAEILKRSPWEQKFINEVKKNNPYSTGFAQAELGGEFSMRRHQKWGPLDYTNVKPEDIRGTFGIYGWVVRGEKDSGTLYWFFKQERLGKELPKWTDETGTEYKKDFASFQRFVKRILTDYEFATHVTTEYEHSLLKFCNNDIWEAAAFNLGGYAGKKAYKRKDYDFKIGKNATIWTYINKIIANSAPNAPKPKQLDVLNYKKPTTQSQDISESKAA